MAHKMNDLILKLTLMTRDGNLVWEETSSRNGFQVKIGKNSVSILCCESYKVASLVGGEDNDIQVGTFSIINSKGESVEIYTKKKNDAGFEQLKELFVTIRRKHNKVEEVIDEMLKELDIFSSKPKTKH